MTQAEKKQKFVPVPERLRLPKPSEFWKPAPKPKATVAPISTVPPPKVAAANVKRRAEFERRLAKEKLWRRQHSKPVAVPISPPEPKEGQDAYDVLPATGFIPPDPNSKRSRRKERLRRRRQRSALKRIAEKRNPTKYDTYMHSPEWAAFRDRIFAARGRKCERCGATDGVLHVHHLHYRNLGCEKPEDVLILCLPCHERTHGKKIRWG